MKPGRKMCAGCQSLPPIGSDLQRNFFSSPAHERLLRYPGQRILRTGEARFLLSRCASLISVLPKLYLIAFFSIVLASTAFAQEVVHLDLEEGGGTVARDSSGLGNDGSLRGSPVYEADTGDGSAFALRFDGVDDSIDLGQLDVAGSGLTLAVWFKADSYPGTYRDPRLISKASGTAANAHVFMLSTIRSGTQTRLRARVRVGGVTTTLVAGSGNLQTGVWQHGALTYDGASLRLYLDGVEVGSTALTGAVDTDPNLSVAVGSQPGSSSRWFDGLIDDVLIVERGLSPAQLQMIVAGNGAPVAVADSYQTDEDSPLSVVAVEGVLANDSDPDSDLLRAELVETVSHGILALDEDGGFDYSPAANYAGEDSFSYRARDASLSSPTVTVSLLVGAVGDEPRAADDSYQTIPNQPLVKGSGEGVLANDSDVDSANLEAVLVTDVTHGALVLNPDGSFNYTPAADFSGSDSFTYLASDGVLESLPATVSIVISAPPVVLDDRYDVTEDTLLVIPPLTGALANDSDTNPPDDLSALLVSGPIHGTLSSGLGSAGGFSYLPEANFAGEDSFVYRALDGDNGTSAEATVTLNVLAVNDVPVALADSYQTRVDEPLLVAAANGVLANDTDADLDANPIAVLVSDVTQGTLGLNADGSFDYTPTPGYVGVDSFSYRVSDGISESEPVAVMLDVRPVVTAAPDTLVELALEEGGGAVAQDSSGLGNDGILQGSPVYEADTGNGSAFALRFDGVDDSIDLGQLDVAGSGLTLALWFKADSYPGTYRDPRLISKASGTAANAHVFMLSTIRSGTQTRLRARVRVGGVTTTLVAGSGNLQTGVWQHGALTYDGASLRLYLDGVEVGSTALTGAVDTDPNLSVAVGSQPGSSSRWFDGLIDDVLIVERGLSPAQLQMIVAGNGAPVAVADSYQTDEDSPLSVVAVEGVLANDSDPDSDLLRAELVETVSHGILALDEDGGFDYSPAANYAGEDSFSYRARDASLSSPTVTVSLLVGAVGDEPRAADDSYQTIPNQPLVKGSGEGVLANDSDVDSANLEAVLVTDVTHGALVLNPDGSFNYTPAADFSGSDSFTYLASDGVLESLPATVSIVISAPPVVLDDRYDVTEDTLLVIPPLTGALANDSDTNPPDDLSALLVSGPIHGTLSSGLGSAGGFSYLPEANFAGEDSFVYRALDGDNGTSAEATVTLNVLAVNDVPVALADSYQTRVDEPLLVAAANGVLANDTDADLDANPIAVLVSDVTQGTLGLNADGSFDYTPTPGYVGVDSFSYRVSDGISESEPVAVMLDVRPVVTAAPDTLVELALEEGGGAVAQDSSGLGNDGILQGSPVYEADTGNGSAFALRFDGVDDSIDLGQLDVAGSGLTLALWFKADSYPGTYRDPRLISKASGTAANAHVFMLSTIRSGTQTRLRARVRVGGVTTTLVAGSGNLQTGVWQHGALTYDGASLRLYLDGVEVGSTALTGAVDTDPNLSVAVGSQPGSSSRWFDGLIDDVLIVERGLSSEEIVARVGSFIENRPPRALFSAAPPFGVAPLAVSFDASASVDSDGQLVAYEWDFGDGNVAAGVTVSHTFTGVGHYKVSLRVMDDRGAVNALEQTIITTLPGEYGPPIAWRKLSATAGDLPAPGGDAPDQTVALVSDINGDGVNDFVIGTRRGLVGPSLEWWERTQEGWSRHLIEPDLLALEAGGAVHDIDGDGDPDLVIGEDSTGDKLYWWENPSPDYTARWPRREIKNAPGRQHHDQVFGDFDGDGVTELAFWNNRVQSLFLAEVPADPTIEPWPATEIYQAATRSEGTAAADIDGDGITDIVAGGYWFKYDGFGGYQANPIDAEMVLTRVLVGQFSEGGRPEVVFDSGDEVGSLRIYQWDGSSWIGRNLAGESNYGHSLNAGDVNGDGNLDIVSAEMFLNESTSPQLRLFYGDGQGNFAMELIVQGIGNHESKLADLDGDGDLDILGKPFRETVPELNIWLNQGERLALDDWQRHVLDAAVPYRTIFVEHGDLDGDGFEDLISGAWWWKNPGTASGNWVRNTIGAPMNQMALVHDFDADGDLDILGTGAAGSTPNSTFYWARNDGAGSFNVFDNIEPAVGTFLQGVGVGEFTPGVIEVALSWQNGNGGLQMLTAPPPASITSELWSWREVNPTVSGEGLDTGDIDGDGKQDILDGVSWFRNEGSGLFTRYALVGATTGEPDRNILADMNGDGNLDAVIGFGHDSVGEVGWFEQPEDPAGLWPYRRIDQVGPAQAQSVDVADLDGDGAYEVVVGEHTNPAVPGLQLQVYRQHNDGVTWIPYLVYEGDEHHDGAQLFDTDNDGDLDIVSIGWLHRRLMMYENRAIQLPPDPVPSVPGELAAVALPGSRVDLFWEPSTDDNGVVGYAIYRDSLLIANVTGTRWSDLNAGGLTDHFYEVIALDNDGNQSLAASVTVSPVTSDRGAWWDANWPYRLLLGAGSNQFERSDKIIEFGIDFTAVLAELEEPGSLNSATLRCHQVGADGEVVAADVPCQFDPDEGFDPGTAARGTILVYAAGTLPARSARYYHIYFDVEGGAGVAASLTPLVTVDESAMDEGQTSYRIATLSGDYHLQKEAGGFSSLLDKAGNDWIDYHPTAGASGSFRGIPNLVYPEAHFHPGSVSAVSELLNNGPLKATIRSTTLDSLWQVVWEFYPTVSRMTVTQADREYWFLYEGTPGGILEPDTDFSVTSDGSSRPLSESWTGDLPADEWVVFADPGAGRSLFLASEEDDLSTDSYRPLDGAMTVFGFGREGLNSSIDRVPAHFTLGLIETTDFDAATLLINSAIKPLDLVLSAAVVRPF